MNSAEANKVDLVDYLYSSGYTPAKIKYNEYWYLSPLRDEKTASFKIERNRNVWYDHGTDNGGTVIDFVIQFFNCDVQTALQKLEAHVANNKVRLLLNNFKENRVITNNNADLFDTKQLSFQEQKDHQTDAINNIADTPFHLHENSLIDNMYVAETAVQIIAAKKPIKDPLLCRYLHQKRINKNIATTYNYEVNFKMENVDDFFNNSCIKNDFENLISSVDLKLKNVSQHHLKNNDQIDHILNKKFHPKQQTKASKSLTIFGYLFSFLNFHTIHQNQKQALTAFLALNTLDLFEKILLLTEKYKQVQLYLRHNDGNKKHIHRTSKRPVRFIDQSNLYKDYVSLNSWLTHFGLHFKAQNLQQFDEMRLP